MKKKLMLALILAWMAGVTIGQNNPMDRTFYLMDSIFKLQKCHCYATALKGDGTMFIPTNNKNSEAIKFNNLSDFIKGSEIIRKEIELNFKDVYINCSNKKFLIKSGENLLHIYFKNMNYKLQYTYFINDLKPLQKVVAVEFENDKHRYYLCKDSNDIIIKDFKNKTYSFSSKTVNKNIFSQKEGDYVNYNTLLNAFMKALE